MSESGKAKGITGELSDPRGGLKEASFARGKRKTEGGLSIVDRDFWDEKGKSMKVGDRTRRVGGEGGGGHEGEGFYSWGVNINHVTLRKIKREEGLTHKLNRT